MHCAANPATSCKTAVCPFPWLVQVLDWFLQICLAVKYCHSKRLLHRDIKTQNIFLTSTGVVKLGDFGISRILQNTFDCAHTFVGTPYYLSPELVQEKPYNTQSDVWAMGVVLYELLAHRHPFNAKDMKGLMYKILRVIYDPPPTTFSQVPLCAAAAAAAAAAVCVCVCSTPMMVCWNVCSCVVLVCLFAHGRPGARDLTVVWGCNRGGGGVPGLTRSLGAVQAQLRRLGCGKLVRAPPLASYRGGATMAQGGLHRGLAVSGGSPGLPVALPTPGHACFPSSPPAPPFPVTGDPRVTGGRDPRWES